MRSEARSVRRSGRFEKAVAAPWLLLSLSSSKNGGFGPLFASSSRSDAMEVLSRGAIGTRTQSSMPIEVVSRSRMVPLEFVVQQGFRFGVCNNHYRSSIPFSPRGLYARTVVEKRSIVLIGTVFMLHSVMPRQSLFINHVLNDRFTTLIMVP